MKTAALMEEPPIELEERHKTTPSSSPPLTLPSSQKSKVNPCTVHNLPRLLQTDLLKLVPFYISVALYFLLVRDGTIKAWSTLFKCAPIVCLMIYIILNAGQDLARFKYSQRILLGLVWSCIGDALLNYDLFPHGMGAFGVAQICYIFAFGWEPLKLTIGIPLYVADFILTLAMLDVLSDILIFGIPIYVTLLLTMCWRSLARASVGQNPVHIVCGLGSVMFVLSDAMIAANMFLGTIPLARLFVMSTYYLAQFSITLSTSEECKLPAILAKWIQEDASHTHAQ